MVSDLEFGTRVKGSEFRCEGLGFRIRGNHSGRKSKRLRVRNLGLGIQALGFRIED